MEPGRCGLSGYASVYIARGGGRMDAGGKLEEAKHACRVSGSCVYKKRSLPRGRDSSKGSGRAWEWTLERSGLCSVVLWNTRAA